MIISMMTTSASLPDRNICRVSTSTVHSENYSLCKHKRFQNLQRQNAMCTFLSTKKMHNDLLIKLEDTEIPVVDEYKFLGVIFNRKLTFIPHIKYLKIKSTRVQQLLRVVTHIEWGADRQTLLKQYRSQICSKVDKAVFICKSAWRFYLKEINPMHHEGLK